MFIKNIDNETKPQRGDIKNRTNFEKLQNDN